MANDDKQLYEDVGFIKGVVSEMRDDIKRLNGDLETTTKKVQRHEVILGKVGLVFATAVFVISLGVNFVFTFIKDKILK